MALARQLGAIAVLALCACSSQPEQPDNAAICGDYGSQSTNQEVIARGKVADILGTRSGRSGSHEGFLLKLDGDCDLTLKVETNVSITGPVPIRRGEIVIVKGEYVYDPLGGILHWTHHDPEGRHIAGYVVSDGKTYW
jgi:hypothetical protein